MNNDFPFRNVDVLYGIDNIINAIEKFIDDSKTKYDVCADSSIPSFIVKNGIIRKFLDFNKKNGHIRYITDVTVENIGYCKQIMKAAYLRHLEGLKGAFRVNETECHYNIVLDEPRQIAIMIRSNMQEIVSQYQKVFDILWEKAIPVKERIIEIEAIEKGIGNAPRITNEEKNTLSNMAETSQPIPEPSSEHQQLKESIEKETEPLLNSRIPDYNKNTRIKIQLWSNNSKSDYGVKLKGRSGFLAATKDTTEEYTDLVEESDYLEDVQYDWNYTLRHWIDNHVRNIICEFTDIASTFSNNKTITTSGAGTSNLAITTAMVKEIQNKIIKRKTYSRQKGTFKCNYCKLIFTTGIKRNQHEQVWHTATKSNRSSIRRNNG
jgi:hypothetical protein